MLTDQIKWHLKFRLGTFDRYAIEGFFYCDETENQFVKRKGYSWYYVLTFHIIGYLVCFTFATYAYFLLHPDTIPDEASNDIRSYSKNLLTVAFLLVLFVLCSSIIIVSSSELNNLSEMLLSYNQGFQLNEILNTLLIPGGKLPPDGNQRFHDNLTKFVCYFPLLAPFLFGGNILHSADPIHNLIQDFLEVPVEFSLLTFCVFMPFVAYGALCLVHHAIVGALQVCIDIFLVEYWFDIVMPKKVAHINSNSNSKVLQFQTAKLGIQTEQNLIIFYRTFQIYNKLCNANLSTNKIASHSVGLMGIAVFGSFILIRYSHLFQSLTELPLMLIMILCTFVAVLIYLLECSNLDSLARRSLNFKSILMKNTRKCTVMHKTAKSFRTVNLKMGGPFFNVNKSTFLDWSSRVLENLVTVLVTF